MRRIRPYKKYGIKYIDTGNPYADTISAISQFAQIKYNSAGACYFRSKNIEGYILDYNEEYSGGYGGYVVFDIRYRSHKFSHFPYKIPLPKNEQEFKHLFMKIIALNACTGFRRYVKLFADLSA